MDYSSELAPRFAFLTAVIDPRLKEQLAESARANERSVSAEVRVALREHLARAEPEPTKGA